MIGGGVAGLAMAVALGVGGVPTVLVDRAPPEAGGSPAAPPPSDGRTAALLPEPVNVLRGLGVWESLEAGAAPLRRMRLGNERRGLAGGETVEFDPRDAGAPDFGYNVANDALRRALLERLSGLDAVTHLRPAEMASVAFEPHRVAVRLADGRRVVARLAVAADGRDSPTRAAAGIAVSRWDYGQTALVCAIDHERPHGGVSTEFHRPGGPFTLVPMPGERSGVVWVERTVDALRFVAMADAAFEAALEERTRGVLGRVRLVAGARHAYPLDASLAARFHGPRLALIAEAAHGLHPIGAQGLNLSLRDVAALAEEVVDAWRVGLDIGAEDLLAAYERRRRPDAVARLYATDLLNRATATDSLLLHAARGLGLRLLDAAGPLKSALIRQGMSAVGGGAVPRLARGEPL